MEGDEDQGRSSGALRCAEVEVPMRLPGGQGHRSFLKGQTKSHRHMHEMASWPRQGGEKKRSLSRAGSWSAFTLRTPQREGYYRDMRKGLCGERNSRWLWSPGSPEQCVVRRTECLALKHCSENRDWTWDSRWKLLVNFTGAIPVECQWQRTNSSGAGRDRGERAGAAATPLRLTLVRSQALGHSLKGDVGSEDEGQHVHCTIAFLLTAL